MPESPPPLPGARDGVPSGDCEDDATLHRTLTALFDAARRGDPKAPGTPRDRLIDQQLDDLVDKRFLHRAVCRPLDDQGFVMGAARLILNDYLQAPRHT